MDRRSFLKLLFASASALALPALWHGRKITPLRPFITSPAFYTPQELARLRITFHPEPGKPHHYTYAYALTEGLKRHGIAASIAAFNTPSDADIAVIWSWKQPRIIAAAQARGTHILVMERGFIQPREQWCSLAFDGFNGFGKFAPAADHGERWEKYFAHWLQPWRKDEKGYVLLIGQVPGDAALAGVDINQWLEEMAQQLTAQDRPVLYRPHPEMRAWYASQGRTPPLPSGTRFSHGTLAEDLAGAAYTVIHSSTTAVESVLAGVPAVVLYEGSIAWPMASHDVNRPFYYPDRTRWCHDMAWRQWTLEEVKDGSAWEHVRQVILKT